jgi:hypothetical protein
MSDDHTRHDGDTVTLPGNPDLKQLATQAKELRRGVQRGIPEQLTTFATHHPDGAARTADPASRRGVSLRDAQLALARKYGFPGWAALTQNVGRARVEERDMHRWFGVEFNNEVWDFLDSGLGPDSPVDDRELAMYAACASARHWAEVGTTANRARGEYMIARVAVAVGEPECALRHARRCLELILGEPAAMADWDEPFGHEALARALAATGDLAGGREHRARAEALAAAVADPDDRAVIDGELAKGPWFGLT